MIQENNMGWSSGGTIFLEVIKTLQGAIPADNVRQRAYEKLIPAFFSEDWDTEDELRGLDPAYDKALDKVNAGLAQR